MESWGPQVEALLAHREYLECEYNKSDTARQLELSTIVYHFQERKYLVLHFHLGKLVRVGIGLFYCCALATWESGSRSDTVCSLENSEEA